MPKRSPAAVSGRIEPFARRRPDRRSRRRAVGQHDPAAARARRLDGGSSTITRSSCSTSCVAASASPKRVIASRSAPALGLELGEPRLQLVRHVVERGAEHRELVPSPHGHALGEVPLRDPAGGLGERAQRRGRSTAPRGRRRRRRARARRAARAAAGRASGRWPRRSRPCGSGPQAGRSAPSATPARRACGSGVPPTRTVPLRPAASGTSPCSGGNDATIRDPSSRTSTSPEPKAAPRRRRATRPASSGTVADDARPGAARR